MDRALILYQQSRYDLAERELRKELAADPNNPMAHALLGLCLSEGKRYEEATREAKEAIRLAPDLAFAYCALADILHERGRLGEAREAIEEALRLEPECADYFARLSAILYDQRRWSHALDAAEKGLAIEAEHVGCNNLRAMALVKLGSKHEAGVTIDAALARDPENAVTHANQGWALLHQGDHATALDHFREALRLNPQLDWAREGIVEALKAKHLLYGLMLRYFLWTSRLSRGAQWGVIIGGYLGYRVLRDIAKTNHQIAPFVWPLLILYLAFAVLTWVADPIFNLILRFNRFGRLALSEEQVMASNWIGGLMAAAVVALLGGLATGQPSGLTLALVLGALILPLAGTFQCQVGRPRNLMVRYTAVAAAAGLIGVGLSATGVDRGLGGVLTSLSLLGSVLSSWAANALMMVRPKR